MKNQIIKIIDYLYKKTGQKISLSDKRWEPLINGFIELLDKEIGLPSIGEEFLRDYFVFQFNYWIDKNTRFDSTIMPNWLLGKSAFQRWNEKNEHWKYFSTQFEQKYKIIFDRRFVELDTEDQEEIERKRYHNKVEGLAHCLEFASYNNQSLTCITCKFRSDCKKIK